MRSLRPSFAPPARLSARAWCSLGAPRLARRVLRRPPPALSRGGRAACLGSSLRSARRPCSRCRAPRGGGYGTAVSRFARIFCRLPPWRQRVRPAPLRFARSAPALRCARRLFAPPHFASGRRCPLRPRSAVLAGRTRPAALPSRVRGRAHCRQGSRFARNI